MSVGGLQAETRKHNHTLSKSGWYRIFKFKDTGYGLFFIGKRWSSGEPGAPLIAFNRLKISSLLKAVSSIGIFSKARIVRKAQQEYHLDIWYTTDTTNVMWVDEVFTSSCTFVDFESAPDEVEDVVAEISLV